MLRIVRRVEELDVGDAVKRRGQPTSEYSLSFSLVSLGISLVLEKPVRREFMSAYVTGLQGVVKRGAFICYELIIDDIQIGD